MFFLYVATLAVHAPFQTAGCTADSDGDQDSMHHGDRAIYKAMVSASTKVSA